MELTACVDLVGGTTDQSSLFTDLTSSYQLYETLPDCFHHTLAMPQPFLLLIAPNLALAGWLGLKMELMACANLVGVTMDHVFFFNLYDSINDMKHL